MSKNIALLILVLQLVMPVEAAWAAYQSSFDAINFEPAVDGGDYFTVYGSQTYKAWQGNLGFALDFANRPLEFRGTGTTTGRQSILDNTLIMNVYGSLGFTDWFTAGVNVPMVLYNWFFTADVTAAEDNGFGMGDIVFLTKFRAIDIDKSRVGLSFIPYVSLPSGDIVRYNGNGHIFGGLDAVFDVKFHERFLMTLNAGYVMRDDVTQRFNFSGGGTSTVRIDDLITAGIGANFKITRHVHAIAETYGSTVMRDFFNTTNSTSLESDAGMRFYIGDSGFSVDVGGGAGLIEGIGTPRFRGFAGLRWISPVPEPCPECAPPDPRIKDNKIVLWGKIFFDTDKATIKSESFPVLDDVVDVLMKNPGITLVEVQGHTDARASDEYNMRLSQRRAESAMSYLISHGISSMRLRAMGYGESRPIATNDTVEGMSQNRRTEFLIISADAGQYTGQPTTPMTP